MNSSKTKQKQRVCDPCYSNHVDKNKSNINLIEQFPEKVQQITKGIDFKTGNLMKLGGKRQNWKLRYFVLNAYSLSYYQEVEEDNVKKRLQDMVKKRTYFIPPFFSFKFIKINFFLQNKQKSKTEIVETNTFVEYH